MNDEKKDILEDYQKDVDRSLIKVVPFAFAKRYGVLPLSKKDDTVIVATSNPDNFEVIDDLKLLFKAKIKTVRVDSARLMKMINSMYHEEEKGIEDVLLEGMNDSVVDATIPQDILESVDDAPAIRLVNNLLSTGIKRRASDIHIEPFEGEVKARFRVDGILHEVFKVPRYLYDSVVSRVKLMASMNIAEKRLPQDGHIRVKIAGRDIDVRTSSIPTAFGERLVLRLLDREKIFLNLEELGLEDTDLIQIQKFIRRNNGIILVTGPTGSGKTTTLYAALSKINSVEKNILTIEDPIEYQLKGIGQMQVNPKIGLVFAKGLRHILRQDPDVIMVGEIRDRETADIAIHAALTGHLVFSTLHTNDSSGAITRLLDMGIEPYLVTSSLIGVLTQRLIRILCNSCKVAYVPEGLEIESVRQAHDADVGISVGSQMPTIYRKAGCDRCMGTGYLGRTGIYEMLAIDDDIRSLILKNADSTTIKKKAVEKGMKTLKEAGMKKVISGITSIEEVVRVIEED